jgi:hypothetical protein
VLPAYKFVEQHHSQDFCRDGKFVVKRLFEYQVIECQGRMDDFEGLAWCAVSQEIFEGGDWDSCWAARELASAFYKNANSSNTHISDCKLVMDASSYLAYCMTMLPTPRLAKRFTSSAEDEAALVKITNLVEFKHLLDQTICAKFSCEPSVAGPVHYVGRTMDGSSHWLSQHHPAFVKPESYSDENEIRFVWRVPSLSWYADRVSGVHQIRCGLPPGDWGGMNEQIKAMKLDVLANPRIPSCVQLVNLANDEDRV